MVASPQIRPVDQAHQQAIDALSQALRNVKTVAPQSNTVNSVTAGDGTVTIGGTLAAPTVAATVGTTAGTVAGGADARIVAAANGPTPSGQSLAAWSFDPVAVAGGTAPTGGTLYLIGLDITQSKTVTAIGWGNNAVGSGAVAGENWAGLYSAAGTLLASAGADGTVTGTGLQAVSIAATALTAGLCWVGLLFNATSLPQLYRGGVLNSTLVNAGVTGSVASARFATNGTGLTALPASITPGSNVLSGNSYWAVVA